jgi:hypothetical protein
MTSNINNNVSIPLLSTSSIRIQSLERHVHQWIVFSLKLIELWQNFQHDTRKLKLKKIFLSNQCQKSLSKQLPRMVDMFFEVKNDSNHHLTLSNDQKIIMSFYEEFTTIRIILCSHPFEYSSCSSGYSSITSIEQQETKDFKLINEENDVDKTQLTHDDENPMTNINIPCINNMNINDINAFICIQPSLCK